MATGFTLPPPPALDIHNTNVSEKWKRFKLAWDSYSLATEINKKSEAIQVATLLTIIGEDARDVFSTFTWESAEEATKIKPVLEQFADYCEPRKNVPFERYRFNKRTQEAGESYDQYRTALRKLAEGCEFSTITPEEILRDRLVFGISDHKVRERLLRESALTLKKTDEICRASESSSAQMREVGQTDTMNVINTAKKGVRQRNATSKQGKACGNCGRHHEIGNCAARGKLCNECGKLNHFASVCRSGKRRTGAQKDVKTVEELAEFDESDGEIYVIGEISAVKLDDSQLVTVKLASGNCLRFQPDTGAQCNVIPLELYKKATNDTELKGVKQAKTAIAAYGGSRLPVVGQVIIPVWREGQRFKLDCKLVDNIDIRPILGRKACLGMNIIQ